MSIQPKTGFTPEEYLALERKSDAKSEYFAGEIFLMAGASERHNLVVANLIAEWRTQLKNRPCKVYPSDMRVKIADSELYTYPDVTVVCGEAEFEDDQKDTLVNPTLIVEVLSESSEAYDRGKKFEYYRRISSLSDYLLIAQDKPEVEQFVRQADEKWLYSAYSGLQSTVVLDSIQCELLLREVYDKVNF
jgi:Uma2 family endonuclease